MKLEEFYHFIIIISYVYVFLSIKIQAHTEFIQYITIIKNPSTGVIEIARNISSLIAQWVCAQYHNYAQTKLSCNKLQTCT